MERVELVPHGSGFVIETADHLPLQLVVRKGHGVLRCGNRERTLYPGDSLRTALDSFVAEIRGVGRGNRQVAAGPTLDDYDRRKP